MNTNTNDHKMKATELIRELREPGDAYGFVNWNGDDEQALKLNKSDLIRQLAYAVELEGDFDVVAFRQNGRLYVG